MGLGHPVTFWRQPGTGLDRTDDLDRAVTAYWRHRTVARDSTGPEQLDQQPVDHHQEDQP